MPVHVFHGANASNAALETQQDFTFGSGLLVGDTLKRLISLNGGQVVARTTVANASYTALLSDYLIAYTSLSTGRIVSLPTAAIAGAGRSYLFKDETGLASAYNITIDPAGSQLIDGAATKVINTSYGAVRAYCTGAAWFTI